MIEKTLWDIPAPLKEYHNIVYDHERNQYHFGGHESVDGINTPHFIVIPSNVRIYTARKDEKIIYVKFEFGELTIYPLSTFFWIRGGV